MLVSVVVETVIMVGLGMADLPEQILFVYEKKEESLVHIKSAYIHMSCTWGMVNL